MLLRLLLSTCRPSRWQLATTTGRKDLAADIDPPYLKNLVARKIFSNLTLHFQKFFINFWYLNEFHVHNIQLAFKELTSSRFYFANQKCWLAIWLQDSLFSPLIIRSIFNFFDSMIVSLYCGLSSKAVFATKCLKRSQASRQARPRKKWSKDVRKIHGHVVKIRVYCWWRSLCKRYPILTVLINPSIKLRIQMRGKGSCVIPIH